MWLVVGLGNPGPKYALTRHNIGFMAIDYFLRAIGAPGVRQDFKAEVAKFKYEDHDLVLLKPLTYMNLSGDSVRAAADFYKIPLENILVLHDEVDLPFGQMKLQKNRGAGGHNGVKDITTKMGSADYARLRLGVGRPPHPEMAVSDFVLQKFSDEEFTAMPAFLEKACDALDLVLSQGVQKAANSVNAGER